MKPLPTIGYYGFAGWWTTNMRALTLALVFSAIAGPCLAQTVLKSEPLLLAPYEIALVQDASCPAGKVLKTELRRRYGTADTAQSQSSSKDFTTGEGS